MAGSVNKVILLGNIGKDPEARAMSNGDKVVSFSLATSESWRDKATGERKEKTEWHNVVMWREMAERAGSMLKKGMLIFVEGKITYRKYTDKEGAERRTTDIVANTFRLLEKREGGSYENRFPTSEPGSSMGAGANTQISSPGEVSPGSDDLPF